MSNNVKVFGIPVQIRMGKLVPLLSKILMMSSDEFYVHTLPIRRSEKEVILSFSSPYDAQQAVAKLDSYVHKYGDTTFIMTAEVNYDHKYKMKNNIPKEQRVQNEFNRQEKGKITTQYGVQATRERSRSPLFREDASNLDMQIEILKKQRMIVEEQRKLYEEQKRLDMLKMESLKNDNRPITTGSFNEMYPSEDVKLTQSSSSKRPNVDKMFVHKRPSKQKIVAQKQQSKQMFANHPCYYTASELLVKKMHGLIKKHLPPEMRGLLVTALRSTLKERIAVAVGNHKVYQASKVISLYRLRYPESEDEDFIKEVIKSLDESGWHDAPIETSCEGDFDSTISESYHPDVDRDSLDEGYANAEGTSRSEYKWPNNANKANQARGMNENRSASKKTMDVDDSLQFVEWDEPTMRKPKIEVFIPKKLSYHQASRILIKKMYPLLEMYIPEERRKSFLTLLRTTLKKRLADAVNGEPIYMTHLVLKLYRMKYPETEDLNFIKGLVKTFNEGDTTTVEASDQESAEGKTKPENTIDEEEDKTKKEIVLDLVLNKTVSVMLRKINIFLYKHSAPNEREPLTALLRSTLIKRLEEIIGDQPVFQIHKIISMYRMKYPQSGDEMFIEELVKKFHETELNNTKDGAADEIVNIVPNETTSAKVDKNIQHENTPAEENTTTGDKTDNKLVDIKSTVVQKEPPKDELTVTMEKADTGDMESTTTNSENSNIEEHNQKTENMVDDNSDNTANEKLIDNNGGPDVQTDLVSEKPDFKENTSKLHEV